MAFWNIDLTTEDGALSAAQMGGNACFIAAVLGLVSTALLVSLAMSGGQTMAGMVGGAFALVEIILFTLAGFRLRAGKGFAWGIVAAILLAIELIAKIATMSFVGAMIDGILLIGVVNGIRGARALGRIDMSAEDVGEIFS